MRAIDIVFLYEHAARELDVACVISAGLRRVGLSVEIIHWPTGFPKAVLQLQPKIVVLPFCYTEQSYDALLAYWRNSTFFNMSWEQLFYLGNQKAKTPRGEFATRHVIHHAWSDSYASFLNENSISSDRIFLNGQPAYTLYDEPYRDYFPSKQELSKWHGLDVSRRWVFFPENYNWAFYSDFMLEQFINGGQSPDDVEAMRKFCDLSLKTVLEWCAKAAQDGIELILRPRPSTTKQDFEEFARQVLSEIPEHLHIVQSGSIREWILASDVVVSSYSTSLIESAVAGKPIYILDPLLIPTSLHVDWHDLLPHIKTEWAFLQVCSGKGIIADERLSNWARQVLMGHADADAIRNLTDFLVSLVRDEIESPPIPTREVAIPGLKFVPPAGMWSIYRRLKQWLRYKSSGGIEPEFVKDALPVSEIENMIARWAVVLAEKE
jgi:surface carbohydrate biosynthesis protein